MKTITEICAQAPVFLNYFSSKEDVADNFCEHNYADKRISGPYDKILSVNILFASYGTDNYSGDAFVIFEREGKLYEVNGGHCSCYGLEGQWTEDDEIVLTELENRLTKGSLGKSPYSGNVFNTQLAEFLGVELISKGDEDSVS